MRNNPDGGRLLYRDMRRRIRKDIPEPEVAEQSVAAQSESDSGVVQTVSAANVSVVTDMQNVSVAAQQSDLDVAAVIVESQAGLSATQSVQETQTDSVQKPKKQRKPKKVKTEPSEPKINPQPEQTEPENEPQAETCQKPCDQVIQSAVQETSVEAKQAEPDFVPCDQETAPLQESSDSVTEDTSVESVAATLPGSGSIVTDDILAQYSDADAEPFDEDEFFRGHGSGAQFELIVPEDEEPQTEAVKPDEFVLFKDKPRQTAKKNPRSRIGKVLEMTYNEEPIVSMDELTDVNESLEDLVKEVLDD